MQGISQDGHAAFQQVLSRWQQIGDGHGMKVVDEDCILRKRIIILAVEVENGANEECSPVRSVRYMGCVVPTQNTLYRFIGIEA